MNWDAGAVEFISGGGSAKFKIGDHVSIVNGPANVRQTPGGTLLGQQQDGSVGTIIGGPVAAAIAGSADPTIYNWWNVDFGSGVDGHVGEGTLIAAAGTPTPTPTTIQLSVNGVPMATGPIDQPLTYKINTNRKTATITVVIK